MAKTPELFDRGLAVRKEVLGAAYVDAALQSAGPLADAPTAAPRPGAVRDHGPFVPLGVGGTSDHGSHPRASRRGAGPAHRRERPRPGWRRPAHPARAGRDLAVQRGGPLPAREGPA